MRQIPVPATSGFGGLLIPRLCCERDGRNRRCERDSWRRLSCPLAPSVLANGCVAVMRAWSARCDGLEYRRVLPLPTTGTAERPPQQDHARHVHQARSRPPKAGITAEQALPPPGTAAYHGLLVVRLYKMLFADRLVRCHADARVGRTVCHINKLCNTGVLRKWLQDIALWIFSEINQRRSIPGSRPRDPTGLPRVTWLSGQPSSGNPSCPESCGVWRLRPFRRHASASPG
jgi:hypothetical protein